MKKTIAMHEEKEQKHKADDGAPQNAVPAYLLERDQVGAAGVGVTFAEPSQALQEPERGCLTAAEACWQLQSTQQYVGSTCCLVHQDGCWQQASAGNL